MGRDNQLSGASERVAEAEKEFERIKIYLRERMP
jgi:hypothetical protein